MRNFRSLQCVDVALDRLTLLLGANNSGKTSLLEALFFAMGTGRRATVEDDIYLAPGEARPPRDREIIVDVLIRPCDDKGQFIESFPEGSYWLALWGNGVSQDNQDNDFMAFRSRLFWNPQKLEYVMERTFLREWREDPSKLGKEQVKTIRASDI